MSIAYCVRPVKVGLAHYSFDPNEFIACIISQTFHRKRHFEAACTVNCIFLMVFYSQFLPFHRYCSHPFTFVHFYSSLRPLIIIMKNRTSSSSSSLSIKTNVHSYNEGDHKTIEVPVMASAFNSRRNRTNNF